MDNAACGSSEDIHMGSFVEVIDSNMNLQPEDALEPDCNVANEKRDLKDVEDPTIARIDNQDEPSTGMDEHSNSKPLEASSNNKTRISSLLVQPSLTQKAEIELKRKAILDSQRNNSQVFSRNKRMFGMLIGTLQKFQSEETDRERATLKRSKIEQKLDTNRVEFKVSSSSTCQDDDNMNIDHEKYIKEDLEKQFKHCETTYRHLMNFIQTEAKPKIFWLPREHNSTTEKRLKETKGYYNLCIAEETAKFKKNHSRFGN